MVSAYNTTFPTCAFWFYLFIIVVTVVNLVMFGIVAKWYKKRERNELLHEQRFVEDYYDKYRYIHRIIFMLLLIHSEFVTKFSTQFKN